MRREDATCLPGLPVGGRCGDQPTTRESGLRSDGPPAARRRRKGGAAGPPWRGFPSGASLPAIGQQATTPATARPAASSNQQCTPPPSRTHPARPDTVTGTRTDPTPRINCPPATPPAQPRMSVPDVNMDTDEMQRPRGQVLTFGHDLREQALIGGLVTG